MAHRYDPTPLWRAKKEDLPPRIDRGEPCIYGEVVDKETKEIKCHIALCSYQVSNNGNKSCGLEKNIKNVLQKITAISDLSN